ncbi:hypothetical protein D3C72_1707150 [compost metagenome]
MRENELLMETMRSSASVISTPCSLSSMMRACNLTLSTSDSGSLMADRRTAMPHALPAWSWITWRCMRSHVTMPDFLRRRTSVATSPCKKCSSSTLASASSSGYKNRMCWPSASISE